MSEQVDTWTLRPMDIFPESGGPYELYRPWVLNTTVLVWSEGEQVRFRSVDPPTETLLRVLPLADVRKETTWRWRELTRTEKVKLAEAYLVHATAYDHHKNWEAQKKHLLYAAEQYGLPDLVQDGVHEWVGDVGSSRYSALLCCLGPVDSPHLSLITAKIDGVVSISAGIPLHYVTGAGTSTVAWTTSAKHLPGETVRLGEGADSHENENILTHRPER